MATFRLKDIFKNQYIKYTVIGILAYLNSFAFAYAKSLGDVNSAFIGTRFWGYNPTSLLYFAVCFFLLNRAVNRYPQRETGKIILSTIFGILISTAFIWGNLTLYGTTRIFDSFSKVIASFFGILGLSIFFIPLFSEICDFFNIQTKKIAEISGSTVSDKPSRKQLIIYFLVTWAIFFAIFMPLFLYWYPGNFVYDAGDQVAEYMSGNMSTHHTIAHTMLLGKLYEFGYKRGNVDIGIAIYSLLQMAVLSFSIAFFLTECRKKIRAKVVRVIIYALFVANIALPYYAISTIKGVFAAAFILIALTLLWEISECENLRSNIKLALCFSVCMIIASLFRNNIIYACPVAGLILIFLTKDRSKRLLFLSAFLLIIIGNIAFTKITMSVWNIRNVDGEREKQSVPLMFLARVEVNHGTLLSENEWEEMLRYVGDVNQIGYSAFISDHVRGTITEEILKNNKLNYYKFIVKMALKYPGDLIESVVCLTWGYWYPDDYPFCMLGYPYLTQKPIGNGLQEIEIKNLLPFGSSFFDSFYGNGYGRYEIPVLGWFWRTTTYTWIFLFGFAYLIYQKRWKQLGIISIPFVYLLTCFLGPVAWMRYVVINVVSLPVMILCMLQSSES